MMPDMFFEMTQFEVCQMNKKGRKEGTCTIAKLDVKVNSICVCFPCQKRTIIMQSQDFCFYDYTLKVFTVLYNSIWRISPDITH